jgi:predicted nucleotidyltransferase
MHSIIKNNIIQLNQLCVAHKVAKLYAFGSVTNESFNDKKSDIDFIAELKPSSPIESGEQLMALWDDLENLFQRKVDLITEATVKNTFLKKSIDSTKVIVYDAQR